MQATTVALECRTEKLFIAEGLDIPDLNTIFDYPDTEESQHAAGFVVTTCGGMILNRKGPDIPPHLLAEIILERMLPTRALRI